MLDFKSAPKTHGILSTEKDFLLWLGIVINFSDELLFYFVINFSNELLFYVVISFSDKLLFYVVSNFSDELFLAHLAIGHVSFCHG
jgi:hypothetical protein